MSIPTMDGVRADFITTSRITTRVLFSGTEDGIPVLFLHGNTSSATWWEETMLAMPPAYRGIAHDQRGFGESDSSKKIDAARGTNDFVDDAVALLDTLKLEKVHVVGNSLGGIVVWELLMQHPERILTVTQIAPGSPYGFGGTKDSFGTPCYEDFAGSGAGLASRELLKRMADDDRSLESRFSPRSALRTLIVKPPFIPEREEALLSSMLQTHLGEQDVPGDSVQSPHWPFVGPGKWGPANSLSPKYLGDISRLYRISPKPGILWVRGSHDLLVSNTAASDAGYLGQLGLIPGWPGLDVFPPQPMIDQIRSVMEHYKTSGGFYQEVVIEDAGHVPFIEKPQAFNAAFHRHLKSEY